MVGDVRVGEWDVQPSVNRLQRGDQVVRLEPKVMQVLVRLAETPGEVVTRDDLIARVWPDVFVTDDVLHRAIRELRRVFGDSTANPRYVETIRKRGYRLIAPIGSALAPVPASISEHRPPSLRWRFPAVAAAMSVLCTLLVLALAWRAADVPSDARARFVPLVSGPLNESDPAISPDGRRVAYVLREAGDDTQADIYIRDLGDGRTLQLTSGDTSNRMPAWSRDGRRMAFIRATSSSCHVIVRTLASNEETRVGPCGNREDPRVTWSADGESLLMSLAPPAAGVGGWRVARVDLSTGLVTPLTEPPAGVIGDHSAVMSPDGRAIAFIRRASGGVSDIHVMPSSGGAPRRVTHDEADLTGIDWTSGGQSILYSTDRAGGYTLWRVPAEGGEPSLLAGGAARMKHPVADRTGRRVVYENWNYEIDLWQISLDDAGAGRSRPQALTTTSDLWNLYPQVSPDGGRIAYVSTQSGSHELWLADRDGSNARQLTRTGRGVVKDPRWSPDGRRLVYLARQTHGLDVHVVDTATGAVTPLTATPETEVAPAWSHDGHEVLFAAPGADGQWSVWAVSTATAASSPRLLLGNAIAAQPSSDGEWLYFTRPDRAGLWRVRPSAPGVAALVVNSVPAGNTSGWTVTPTGVYFTEAQDDGVRLRRAPLEGGASREVAALDQLTWPGFSISPDGSQVVYARWERRESNIMAIEY